MTNIDIMLIEQQLALKSMRLKNRRNKGEILTPDEIEFIAMVEEYFEKFYSHLREEYRKFMNKKENE